MEQVEPAQALPQPEGRRRALFAAAGERIYLIEKLQAEVSGIYAELNQKQPEYPPKTGIPAAVAKPPTKQKGKTKLPNG